MTTHTDVATAFDVASGPGVDFEQTRDRAGTWIEPGTAAARLQRARADMPGGSDEPAEREVDVVVIGAGQAGLSVGHHLARHGLDFVILEANKRVGDVWRHRWDSLRLFSPARFDGLDGMRFPAPPDSFPTKDEMADFLEAYAAHFALPVRTGVRVDAVTRDGERYTVRAGTTRWTARHVVVAAASYQAPKRPAFAAELDASIRQLHAASYRNPSQLNPGSVLLVGAGNSGAEIAIDLARTHRVWLAGRHPGHIPFEYDSRFAHAVAVPIIFRVLFHRLLSVDTPLGRKARPHFLAHGVPLIRVKPKALDAAGVVRVPRLAGTQDGLPRLDDGRTLAPDNVIWCTGYRHGLDWLQLPVFDADGRPVQYRGVAADEPGLYFAGLPFQHSPSSTMIHGAGRDARRVADTIVQRLRATARTAA